MGPARELSNPGCKENSVGVGGIFFSPLRRMVKHGNFVCSV